MSNGSGSRASLVSDNDVAVPTGPPPSKPRTPPPAVPTGSHLMYEHWHGVLPNEDTARMLKEEGSFLVRQYINEKHGDPILLSIRDGKKVQNAVIEVDKDGRYGIQKKFFDNISELINYYKVTQKPINIKGVKVVLGKPVKRAEWELRHAMVRLKSQLGSGAYGIVFSGTLSRMKDGKKLEPIPVAVKVLTTMKQEAANDLWHEARIMQAYDHPNVVKFYGVANDCRPFYLVMEICPGGGVDSFLKKLNCPEILTRLKIIYEASLGIDYLHSKGCIHRDIATRNLLMDGRGVTKVTDFGMTRRCSSVYKIDPNKPTNLRWLDPEAYRTGNVNKATDMYAFGVLMWEVFTVPFQMPYQGYDADWVNDNVVEGDIRLEPPFLMPRWLVPQFKDCLHRNPDLRPTFHVVALFLNVQIKQFAKKFEE